jgi:hypothetical protein
VIVVEGDRAAVVGPVVGLDDDALRAPKEVDGPEAELDVDLWRRDAVTVGVDRVEKEGSRSERVRSLSTPSRWWPLSSA